MGRMYTAVFEGVAVTVAQDLFNVLAPADSAIIIHGLFLSQSSDAGDSESEQLSVRLFRVTGAPTDGTDGTTPTPQPLMPGDAASGATVRANDTTTRLTGGTAVTLHRESFNVMAGLGYIPTPEMRPKIAPSTRFMVGLETAPADSLTVDGTIYFEEIGG